MTDIVARLREISGNVSRGGWVLYLPDNTIKEFPETEKFRHLRLSTGDIFTEAADTIERLTQQLYEAKYPK